MRNAILRELMTEYEQLRAADAMEEERRRRKVSAACPEIAALLEERQRLIFSGVRSVLAGQSTAENLPQQMDVLTQQIARLLQEKGYAPDYLDPVYRCKRCKDTGYVGDTVREMCDCMKSRYYARLYRRVGLSEKGEQSFENYDETLFSDAPLPHQPISQRQCMAMLRDVCKDYADKYPASATPDLLLMGQSGLGKTFLMHAMAKRLLDRGLNVLMISAYRFLDIARKAYFSGGTGELDTLMETDVLMLDDLGSEPLMENITIVQLFNLINERQTAGHGTVISTNLTPGELQARYTERIVSRLMDPRQCTPLQFLGDDIRRRKA